MNEINRRKFLKIAGTTIGGAVFAEGCSPKATPTASGTAVTGTPAETATPTATPTITTTLVNLTGLFVAGCGKDCTTCPPYQACGGCFSDKCTYCKACEIKACTNRHSVSNCGQCLEYPCKLLETTLQKRGPVEYQNQKAVLDTIHRLRG